MSELDQIFDRIRGKYEIVESIEEKKSEVQTFYANKTLLITGATGFMGKCLVEKLLRGCPDLKHIYLLVRPKQYNFIDERLNKFFEHEIFNTLKKMNPSFKKKVTAMEGELFLKNIGLSDENQDIIKRETNVIFHNAANVKFIERVHRTLKANVIGTMHMLDLTEECNNLEAFVYVSTAYSHCYSKRIEEQFYQPPGDLKMIYDMIDDDIKTDNGLSKDDVKKLIGGHPNLYTFSKAMAEDLVRQRSEKATFACGIYRPSIVSATLKEPLAGWIGNMNGPPLIYITTGLGTCHTAYYHRKTYLDLVPCDMTINALLAVTWDLSNRWATEQKAVIYNYGSSTVNPIAFIEIYNYFKNMDVSYRSYNSVWLNFFIDTERFWLFVILNVLLHFIPALFMDLFLLITFKKPRAVLMAWKITKYLNMFDFFYNINWEICMPETLKVIDRLNIVDKELFFCDLRILDWEEYCTLQWKGIRAYLLKESINSKAGTRRYILLWYLHYGLITVLVLVFSYFIMRLAI